MRVLHTLALISVLFILGACNTNQAEQVKAQEELYNQVMSIHDEVMPRMGELNALGRDLKALNELPDSVKTNVSTVVTNLEQAHEGMMAWMHDFQTLDKMQGKSHEEVMAYLNEELTKVEAVKTNMLQSITEGKSLLEQLKTTK